MAVFPYRRDNQGKYYPIVGEIKLGYKQKVVEALALVDSGATISIFKAEIADLLGIDIESGKETYLGGVGGRIKGYIHNVELEVAGKKFECPMVFSREYTVSFSLLGRQGFFEEFDILFEERKGRVQLI